MDESRTHPYDRLDPDTVLEAVERTGRRPSGHLLALNSYENRVYQIGLEDGTFVVGKFYRPGRWSDAAILEEHAFARELAGQELPVVTPLADAGGTTLHEHAGFRYALYPRQGGRCPELDSEAHLLQIGRLLGRMHAIGALRPFRHRPALDIDSFGRAPSRWLLAHGFLPVHVETAYRTLVEDLLVRIEAAFARAGEVRSIRLHGDCHAGNLLWTDAGPHFVDLDDARMGPAVQDLWMLAPGEREERALALSVLIEGYEQFRDFDRRELHLVEALRTLRMIHYAAWLARRCEDPAFRQAFPWFYSDRYWEEHILQLREQAAALDEPPVSV
ncbi:MAG TPA: serine/threonine protein kinase [Thiotrichales bacterium]|nr:serine/threonine protein kinase [Thiotrichales bacterium]